MSDETPDPTSGPPDFEHTTFDGELPTGEAFRLRREVLDDQHAAADRRQALAETDRLIAADCEERDRRIIFLNGFLRARGVDVDTGVPLDQADA